MRSLVVKTRKIGFMDVLVFSFIVGEMHMFGRWVKEAIVGTSMRPLCVLRRTGRLLRTPAHGMEPWALV